MLPDRCSVGYGPRRCPAPPEFIISVQTSSGQYMVGVCCRIHVRSLSEKVGALQEKGHIPAGRINLEPVRAVGTDCIKGCDTDTHTTNTSLRP